MIWFNEYIYTICPADVLDRVKLADFGISRRLPKGASTHRSGRAGTQCWMATETLNGGNDTPYKQSTDIQVSAEYFLKC